MPDSCPTETMRVSVCLVSNCYVGGDLLHSNGKTDMSVAVWVSWEAHSGMEISMQEIGEALSINCMGRGKEVRLTRERRWPIVQSQ